MRKRYLLFLFDAYEASGGWDDLHGQYETLEEATTALHAERHSPEAHYRHDHGHVVDLETLETVARRIDP